MEEFWNANEIDPVCYAHNYSIHNITDEYAATLVKDRVEIVIKAYVLPCVLAVGVVGNLLFLIVLARVRSMRTITNFFLANMAIADLIYMSVGIGEKLWRYQASPVKDDDTVIGTMGCVFFPFIVDFCFTTSVLLVTIVSFERYYAICKPLRHRHLATWSKSTKLVVATWIVSFILPAILIPGHYKMKYECYRYPDDPAYESFPSLHGYCVSISRWYVLVGDGFQVIPFFIALIVDSILYTLIIKSLHDRVKTNFSDNPNHDRLTHDRNAVTKMLVITGVLLFLCLSPYQVLILSFMISGAISNEAYDTLNEAVTPYWAIFQTLMYVNSALNPYVYGTTNARYRHALIKTFHCRQKGKKKENSMTMSTWMSTKSMTHVIHSRGGSQDSSLNSTKL